jgi:hypothetical protein
MRVPKIAILVAFAVNLPFVALAQQSSISLSQQMRLEIPAARAAQERQLGVLLGGRNEKEATVILDRLKALGKDCLSCIITVTNDPPKLVIGSPPKPVIDFVGIAGDPDGEVQRAEDCPKAKPFYSATKKRCYKLADILKVADASPTK